MSWVCSMCQSVIPDGMGHACAGPWPQQPFPTQPMYPPAYPVYPTFQPIPPAPFTLEDIRRVVREELDRKPDSANVLQENNHE